MAWKDLEEDIAELFGDGAGGAGIEEVYAVHAAERQAQTRAYDRARKVGTKFARRCANPKCGRAFATARAATVYCASACRLEAHAIRRHARRRGYKERECGKCGRAFSPGGPRLRVCPACKEAAGHRRNAALDPKNCIDCCREFTPRWMSEKRCAGCYELRVATAQAARNRRNEALALNGVRVPATGRPGAGPIRYGERTCKRCGCPFEARWPASAYCDGCPGAAATRVAARVTAATRAGTLRPHG